MIDAPLALALAMGMVAVVNPCGFAMLPAYLSFFLGLEGESRASTSLSGAVAVAASVTAGFLLVFATVGTLIETFSLTVQDRLPWFTILIGTGLVALGLAQLRGFDITRWLPKLSVGGDRRSVLSMMAFGASYATASLSCTIGPFLAVTSATFTDANVLSGIATFVVYGLGMGLTLAFLTVAVAGARDGAITKMKRASRYVRKFSNTLVIAAGAYLVYFGIYELLVFGSGRDVGGPAGWIFQLNSTLTNWVRRTGAPTLAGTFLVVLATILFVSRRTAPRPMSRHDTESDSPTPKPGHGSHGEPTGSEASGPASGAVNPPSRAAKVTQLGE
ncbi:MAG: cytochrome C biogenesis protein CcdA [Acidimicrobiales bacterium]|nr:MAG: cytochrome C biogenesis protein CcdA [Acidimicrobiales bacterium]